MSSQLLTWMHSPELVPTETYDTDLNSNRDTHLIPYLPSEICRMHGPWSSSNSTRSRLGSSPASFSVCGEKRPRWLQAARQRLCMAVDSTGHTVAILLHTVRASEDLQTSDESIPASSPTTHGPAKTQIHRNSA